MAKLLHLKRPRLALTRTTNDEDDDILETTKRRKVDKVRKMELAAEMEWALYQQKMAEEAGLITPLSSP